MYFLSKFIWVFLSPLNFLFILLLFSFFLKILNFKMFSKFILIFSFCFFIAIGFFPMGQFLLFKLEHQYQSLEVLPNEIDGLIVLGGPSNAGLTTIYDQVNFNDGGERLTEAVLVIKKSQPKKIIFSGGTSKQNFESSHAFVAKKFFHEMEINTNNIYFEYKSRNTYENIFNSKITVNPKKNEKWIIITSSFHMPRAMKVADKLEWRLIPYPVDYRTAKNFSGFHFSFNLLNNINSLDLALHEYVGLISYYLLGRTNEIL